MCHPDNNAFNQGGPDLCYTDELVYKNILIKAWSNGSKMSSEEKNDAGNKNKRPRKSQEDKELEAMDVESTAGGKGGGGG